MLGGHNPTIAAEIFPTVSPVFSKLVIVLKGGAGYLAHEVKLFKTLRTINGINGIRPFKLVFLLKDSYFNQDEDRYCGRWQKLWTQQLQKVFLIFSTLHPLSIPDILPTPFGVGSTLNGHLSHTAYTTTPDLVGLSARITFALPQHTDLASEKTTYVFRAPGVLRVPEANRRVPSFVRVRHQVL